MNAAGPGLPELGELLRTEVARVARLPVAAVTRQQSLLALGFDSLAVIELLYGLEQALGVTIPAAEILDGIDLAGLETLVAALLPGAAASPAPAAAPAAGAPAADLPLSPGQLSLWLVQQVAAHSGPLHIAAAARVVPQAGRRLDTDLLDRCLAALAERHPVLLSAFGEQEGGPRQRFGAGSPPELVEADAAEWTAPQLDAWCERQASRPFDLAAGPLLRLAVARRDRDAGGDVVVFAVHHLVADFWSVAVLARDLSALYQGEPLPRLPLTYADHLRRQAERLASPDADRLWAYWREQLAAPPASLALPADRPRPLVRSYRGGAVHLDLGAELSAGLGGLARRSGTTLFTVLLAAFQALLGRLGGERDLVVGSPAAGRDRPELAGLAGYFVNMMPLRADLAGDPAFAAVLAQARARVLGALAHQEVPLLRLAEQLLAAPTGGAAGGGGAETALFTTACVLQRSPAGSAANLAAFALGLGEVGLELAGFELRSRPLPERWSQFDLVLRAADLGGTLATSLQWSADLFEPATAKRILGHLRELLAGAVAAPEQPLSALPLLSAAARHQLLAEWNDTARAAAAAPWLHQQIAAQARQRPDATAIADGAGLLSYGELDRQAARLAGRLRALGAGPEVRVAVCVERSAAQVICCLAVLAAGGAYVAFDPTHPEERLAWQLADCGAPVLLTRPGGLADLAAARGIHCLFPQPFPIAAAPPPPPPPAPPQTALAPALTAANLAYVIYTSGSTGRPKAVDLCHGGLCNLVAWQTRALGVGAGDRTTLLAATGFDASVLETWVYLAAGATLVVPADALRSAPEELRAWIAAQQITVHFLPTALAEALFDLERDGLAGPCPAWRLAVAGGDRLHGPPPPALPCRVVNAYGPTEVTVVATACPVPPAPFAAPGDPATTAAPPRAPSIGRPLDNVRLLVAEIDPGVPRPAPAGVPGELLVGGAGLGRGYLHRPDLTAERFVPDPFAGAPGERLYRTGDLVRWSPAGEIEFLGRIDQQLKIRGQRVELGEIEAVLASHPAVREAAALAVDGTLVACICPRDAAAPPPATAAILAHARRSLPSAMLPSRVLRLAALPLNHSGKVDRRALRELALAAAADADADADAPGDTAADPSAPHLPATPIEELLAGLWCEVLGVRQARPHDHFFALGGHSLKTAQLRSRVRTAFGVELPLHVFFAEPTLGAQAAAIAIALRQADAAGTPTPGADAAAPPDEAAAALLGGAAAPPIAAIARSGDLQLSFAQQRLWFLDQLAPGTALYNVPMAAVLRGELDLAALRQAFGYLVRRHESLRTTFCDTAAGAVQRIAPPTDTAPPLPVVDLQGLPAAARAAARDRLLAAAARRPFDLARGPLLRTLLLRSARREHLLLIALHHVITDGWSTGVVVRELSACYGALAARRRPELPPPPPIQYADYAAWQRAWLAGPLLAAQMRYWRGQLAGLETSELPADRPRPAVETFRGARRPATLDRELTAALHALARGAGATLYMVLLAAFDALLAAWSGRADAVVGTPVANRNRRETEDVIGFFVNTLVMRTSLGGDPSLRTLLGRVRETALAAYVHEDVPFEKVVEELQPTRDLSRNPLFQVMLAVQNVPLPALALPGLEVAPLQPDLGLVKFDLALVWEETEGRLAGQLEFSTELFDTPTMLRLLGQYETLLARAAADPDRPLSALAGPAPAELHQMVVEWNDTGMPRRPRRCIHQWVEEQAAATPDDLALIAGETALTYRQLNGMANRLAHHLRRQGIGPDVLVGVCVDRTWALVTALLGVLKAGGAVLALDPTYPEERLRYVIRDAGVALLIAEDKLLPLLPDTGAPRFRIDAEWPRLDGESTADPAPLAAPDNLMYAIYTSGSTGLPKGVGFPHDAFVNLLEWQFQRSQLAPRARTAQFATFGFCVSFLEIFSVLCAGGTLVMVPEEHRRDMVALWRHLEAHGIERLHLPFAALKQLADVCGEERRVPSRLREVVTSGEQLQIGRSIRNLFTHLPGCALHNQYGTSEIHVVSSFRLPGAPADWPDIAPVGRPVGNAAVHLLDAQLRPVPAGVMGELYAGGACLARGYLGAPAQTARQFVPDPFAARRGEPGARLYRTGDLARCLADGRLEWFGRIDNQVRIRGFRVELGEVETVVKQHPLVRNAAVAARPGAGGTPRLVAYVVPASGTAVPDSLRAFLKAKLPEHMLPAAFVAMAELPLNANGKLDFDAFPEPGSSFDETAFVAPAGPVEELVAQIWGKVLGLPKVGARDSFFTLGGHSLLATQVVNRIRRDLAVELPLRALFEGPTVAELAAAVTALETRPGMAAKIARALLTVRGLSAAELSAQLRAQRPAAPGSAAAGDPAAAAAPSPSAPPPVLTRPVLRTQVALPVFAPAPGSAIDLRQEERRQLERLLAGVTLDPHADLERFVFESKLVFHQMPQRLRRALLEFGRQGNLDGGLLLRGLAEDPVVPPTPVRSGERPPKATFASELWLCAVASALGEPVGYLQEKEGHVLQDIFPTPGNADKQSSESSAVLLAFHTETAFHPFMPDYVLLYGLRQDPDRQARTMFSSVRRFFHQLGPADREVLFSPLFVTGIDYSFGNVSGERGRGPVVPVFSGDRQDPFMRYDLDLMVGETRAARRALEVIRELVDEVKREVVIEPGSLLVIDNRRSVHARSMFRAAFDGRDRWLQRTVAVRDLDASIEHRRRGSRVIATDFSRYLEPVGVLQ